jgi:hypothetical protein
MQPRLELVVGLALTLTAGLLCAGATAGGPPVSTLAVGVGVGVGVGSGSGSGTGSGSAEARALPTRPPWPGAGPEPTKRETGEKHARDARRRRTRGMSG